MMRRRGLIRTEPSQARPVPSLASEVIQGQRKAPGCKGLSTRALLARGQLPPPQPQLNPGIGYNGVPPDLGPPRTSECGHTEKQDLCRHN